MRPVILITKQTRGCYITALLPWCLLVMPCHLFFLYPPRLTQGGAGGGTPGFKCRYDQVGAKIKTPKYPWAFQ